jgi:8-oxo-dGTP pyrophosphatase MutT (NUDIX family)
VNAAGTDPSRGQSPVDVPESWTVLESRTDCEGPVVSVHSEVIRGPDGESFSRQVVRHPGAVAVVAVDEDDRVLVLRQYRHPVAERLVELPAGLLDVDGEDLRAAAERELAEEAMLAARHWSVLVDLLSSPGISDERVRIFLAEGLSDVPAPDGFQAVHEEADMSRHWVPLAELVTNILAGDVKDGLTVSGSLALWARRHENTGR